MKNLIIRLALGMTSFTLGAMQQSTQMTQHEVPKLQMIIPKDLAKKIIEGSIDKRGLFEALQSLPETIRERVQKVITGTSISFIIKGKPVKSYHTRAGQVTEFTDGSKRIDNYLGIGDTLYLSNGLQHYLHIDAAGNEIINSLYKVYTHSDHYCAQWLGNMARRDHYSFPKGISSLEYSYKVTSSGLDTEYGPFLHLFYPGVAIIFQASLENVIENIYYRRLSDELEPIDYRKLTYEIVPKLHALHKAIMNINKNDVQQILRSLEPDDTMKIVINYLLVTDNALHRAVKKSLDATGAQLEDAKAIIQMLLVSGTAIDQKNSDGNTAIQLAAQNPDLLNFIRQALVRRDFLAAITHGKGAEVETTLARLQQQGSRKVKELVNTSYGVDIPLVHALKLALQAEVTDKVKFGQYIHIANLLIKNGATLNNPSGKEFLEHHHKEYTTILSPHLYIQ